jgi:hypothetical protein
MVSSWTVTDKFISKRHFIITCRVYPGLDKNQFITDIAFHITQAIFTPRQAGKIVVAVCGFLFNICFHFNVGHNLHDILLSAVHV